MTRIAGWCGRNFRVVLLPVMALAAVPGGLGLPAQGQDTLRRESFDRDPGWEAHNNRPTQPARAVRQDFGFSTTSHAGGERGEIGGFITPAAEPAWYAARIREVTLNDRLTASGRVTIASGGNLDDGAGNTLLGFFQARTLNEWRTPNTLALRLNGRGDVFHAHVEYCTRKWRAGGDFFAGATPPGGRRPIQDIPARGSTHRWSLRYEPGENNGGGVIHATLDDRTLAMPLDPGHRADGALFDHFGLLNVMKSADGGGSLWVDDLEVNGTRWNFERDPQWERSRNRAAYRTQNVRPWFNYGHSPTRHAGGKRAGELGGLLFRGDCRYPDRLSALGDRLQPLDLNRPLHAGGRVVLRRGVTDSTVLFGFYHSQHSLAVNPSQVSGVPGGFLGVAIEGPSREGFFLYPLARTGDGAHQVIAGGNDRPRIYPDGRSHAWTLDYDPNAAAGLGRIRVTLDGQSHLLELPAGYRTAGAGFDRFGFVTTWIDGNGQLVYLDDLVYTCR